MVATTSVDEMVMITALVSITLDCAVKITGLDSTVKITSLVCIGSIDKIAGLLSIT